MPKFSRGDRVRLIPDILPALLGVHRDATCTVVQSRVSFGRGPAGEIDVQLPDGGIVKSLPAVRFEHVAEADRATPPEESPAHRSRRTKVSRRLHFTDHQRS